MRKLKIVVLFSGSASSLRYLLENDPNYNVTYEVVFAVSNKKGTKGEKFCTQHQIPFEEINTKKFCIENGHTGKLRDMPIALRSKYYAKVLESVREYKPDVILLSGFMLEITEPLLGYYLIINVHPADLRIKGENGKPKYTGDDAVTMAIEAGEKSTASTIHIVEGEVDCGRIICVSDHLVVEPGISSSDHQEKMKMLCDGPAYKKALGLIANGELFS